MTWRVWGTRIETAEMVGTTVHQPFLVNKNLVFRAVRTWVIHYNNPTYTDLSMKLYSGSTNDAATSLPKVLLASSTNVQTKAVISTLDNANKEIWFQFADIALKGSTLYHLVLNGTGYTDNWPTDGIAWRKAFPDPVYTTNVDVSSITKLGVNPYMMHFIGADI